MNEAESGVMIEQSRHTAKTTGFCLRSLSFCVSRMEGRSVRSTERSEARNVATRSEA
jgi:hypothetical protein